MKIRIARSPFDGVLGQAMEDIKRGDLVEQVPPLTIHTCMYAAIKQDAEKKQKTKEEVEAKQYKHINVRCPYCSLEQRVTVLPNEPTVICCGTFTKSCGKNFLVEFVDNPLIKTSKIDWE